MSYKVVVSCDNCGNGYRWEDYTITMNRAMRIARGEGWSVGKKGWLCPACRKPKAKVKE